LGKCHLTAALPILVGAAPLGALLVRFRDAEGSHLMPVLLVTVWILGALGGAFVGAKRN
jgi:hypothetical protein